MKRLLLLLLFIGYVVASWAQEEVTNSLELVSNVDYKVEAYPSALDVFLAIKGENRIVEFRFTPIVGVSEDNTGWNYRWSVNGENINVGHNPDSSSLIFELRESGLYTIEAFKDGADPISQTFRTFFVNVDEKTMITSLSDERNCEFFKLKLSGYTPVMYDASYGGSGNVEYTVDEINWIDANKIYDGTISRSTMSNKSGKYSIKIKDGFGFVWRSESVEYESVIPEAKPKIRLLNEVNIVGEVGGNMGQAPLDVEFTADDIECNADEYQWFLYKDTSTMVNIGTDLLDSLIEGRIREGNYVTYTYENTGRYMVQLVATNTIGNQCRDTSEINYVNVVESLVDVPNVFTPNGDGKNDIFMVLALSIESFHGIIINRWGRKVYEWSDPTGGWDGRINGRYANPGTYYYIITARGLERTNAPKYVKKGALMLIR